MALRDFPSSGSARASARLLRTMALPRQPPLPHYVDGNWVIRDARTPVECRPQADTWGVVRDLKTGFVIILARGESAGIPGRRAGPFQHSRGQESRAWQPTSDDMAQAGMFTNVNGGSTATGSIYGSRANGMGACFCDSSGPNYSSRGSMIARSEDASNWACLPFPPCACLGRQCGVFGVRQYCRDVRRAYTHVSTNCPCAWDGVGIPKSKTDQAFSTDPI
jgi:hypothetical protein